MHCRDDGARGNGRAGELVKRTAITPHSPAFAFGVFQRMAVKTVHPIRALFLDAITQPWGFAMAEYPDP